MLLIAHREVIALVQYSLILLVPHALVFVIYFWIPVQSQLNVLSVLRYVASVARVELHVCLIFQLDAGR